MPSKTQDGSQRDHASAEQPRPQDGASRECTRTGQSPTRTHAHKSAPLTQYNLAQACIHKTARNPIVIKGNAMAIANAVELEGCRMGEHAAIKKAPRLISEEPPIAFMKKTASRRVRSHRCRQSPNRAYRPCRSNRNGWHSSTPGLHRPNTSQPGRRR